MKGFLACCLAAVPDMAARPLARPIHLAISYDEEVGCVGVRDLIARLRGAPIKPAGCFVGEPTLMGVVIGHKGKRSLRVTVRGRTCHSSLAPHGVNAVEYAARLIVRMRDIAQRLAREGPRDPLYDVPYHDRPYRHRERRHRAQHRAGPVRVRVRVPLDRGRRHRCPGRTRSCA